MENLIDRRCTGCVRDCDNELYYKCAQNDYYFYKRKNEEESLFLGEKCNTCKNKFCSIDEAEKCIDGYYELHEKKEPLIRTLELAQSKPKYKAFGFTGKPLDIVEELNKFFAENSQGEVVNITKLDSFGEYYPGVMVVVREN